jgi:hypothetical protein
MNLPPEVLRQLQEKTAEIQRKHAEWTRRFGHIRPLVSSQFQDQRVVAVGSRIFYSPKWKTFHDFLVNYLQTVMGKEWGEAEISKDLSERHPVIQWYHHLCLHQQEVVHEPGKVYGAAATGPVMAYMSLGYDLYALEHHALLQERLIQRLRHRDQFQGARYETYVAATHVRAGFDVVLEDESDKTTSHCEFVATHKNVGTAYSVEAKSRHRPGYLGRPGTAQRPEQIKPDVAALIARALQKQAAHERVIFIDVNVPPIGRERLGGQFLEDIATTIEPFKHSSHPPAFVIFTNYPYHYVDHTSPDPGHSAVFTGINMPYFEARSTVRPLDQQPAIAALWHSVLNHTEIPANFEI